MKTWPVLLLSFAVVNALLPAAASEQRPRAREAGVVIGTLPTGPRNAITDVAGVGVGHATLEQGTRLHTGVTVIAPHTGNLYRQRVPAAHGVAHDARRGTREADYMIGGFFDRYSAGWTEDEIGWYERVVEEDDVDIMAWALGTGHPPVHLDRPEMIAAMRRLDYIPLP